VRARLASSTTALLVALLIVHVWLVLFNVVLSPGAMNDVHGVYRRWMRSAVDGTVVGIDQPWVYPIAALLPLVLAYLPGDALYPWSWVLLVTLLDLAAAVLLVRRGGPRGRSAAWWFVGYLPAVGPVAIGRLDGVAVPIAIAAIIVLARRPAIAGVLLGLATWMKVWPAAIVLAAVIAVRGRLRLLVGGLATTVGVVGLALVLGAGTNVVSFLTTQSGRGLQVESIGALPFLWAAALGVGDGEVYYDREILTFQVRGSGTQQVASGLDPVLALVVLGLLALAVLAVRRSGDGAAVFPVVLIGLTTALMVFDKVLSPQYLTWFAPAVVLVGLADDRVRERCRGAVRGIVAAAVLTQLIYPYLYFAFLALHPALLVVATLRDGILIAVLAWSVVALGKLVRAPASDVWRRAVSSRP
jgi:hypothetical protein